MRTRPFILVVSFVLGAAVSAVAAQVSSAGGRVYKPGQGVSAPRIVREFKPRYTADAMAAKVEGVVKLEFVVLPDGKVEDVKVVRSLHSDLDQEAIKAVKGWEFKPGTKDGEPVAVLVTAELTFRLRDPNPKPILQAAPAGTGAPTSEAAETAKAVVYKPGDGVEPPRVVYEVKPVYPSGSKDSGIQGRVLLEAVVESDGSVGAIHVTRSLDPGLDLEAIKAVRQWRFEPGTKDGKPVAVQVEIELTFTLR